MKKDWSAIHKLLSALSDCRDTYGLHVYISVHNLPDAEIDNVVKKIPTGYEIKEEISHTGNTGWMKASAKYNTLGFNSIELTMFFDKYSREKHEERLMSKGGDIK